MKRVRRERVVRRRVCRVRREEGERVVRRPIVGVWWWGGVGVG